MSTATCSCCGASLDGQDREYRFRLPEPVLHVRQEERIERTWGNDVMLSVRGVGAFVRSLLEVQLTDGLTVAFGVWVGVHPDELTRIRALWDTPAYASLEISGHLANRLPGPWASVYRAHVHAVVSDPRELPQLVSSPDPLLTRLIGHVWDHDAVLRMLPV